MGSASAAAVVSPACTAANTMHCNTSGFFFFIPAYGQYALKPKAQGKSMAHPLNPRWVAVGWCVHWGLGGGMVCAPGPRGGDGVCPGGQEIKGMYGCVVQGPMHTMHTIDRCCLGRLPCRG